MQARPLPDHGTSQGERDAAVGRDVHEGLPRGKRLLPGRGIQRGEARLVLPPSDL